MVNPKLRQLGAERSVIRQLFEEACQRRLEKGEAAVCDFTLGNPAVEPPIEVKESLLSLISQTPQVKLHGYTSAAGDFSVRTAIADYIRAAYGFSAEAERIYLTVGAAGALTCALTALLLPNEEVIVPAPFFPEYRVFIERTGAKMISVPCLPPSFLPDMVALENAITERTKILLINSPNNPTGAIYPPEILVQIAKILAEKEKTFGHPIYLLSDEPYRELVYDTATVPYPPCYHKNCLLCYSFSKSLSLPGERIGYLMVSPLCEDADAVFEAVCGAGRALGFVCAPALFQFLIPHCLGKTADISAYDRNRRILLDALSEYGYQVTPPQGAFYLFLKAPNGDSPAFAQRAKAKGLFLVPADSFGCSGFLRIAYCVLEETVLRSLPIFAKLADLYGLTKTEKG